MILGKDCVEWKWRALGASRSRQESLFIVERQLVYTARCGTPPHLKTCLEDRIPVFCPQRVGRQCLLHQAAVFSHLPLFPVISVWHHTIETWTPLCFLIQRLWNCSLVYLVLKYMLVPEYGWRYWDKQGRTSNKLWRQRSLIPDFFDVDKIQLVRMCEYEHASLKVKRMTW